MMLAHAEAQKNIKNVVLINNKAIIAKLIFFLNFKSQKIKSKTFSKNIYNHGKSRHSLESTF